MPADFFKRGPECPPIFQKVSQNVSHFFKISAGIPRSFLKTCAGMPADFSKREPECPPLFQYVRMTWR